MPFTLYKGYNKKLMAIGLTLIVLGFLVITVREYRSPYMLTIAFGDRMFPVSPEEDCRSFKRFNWRGEDYFYGVLHFKNIPELHIFSGWDIPHLNIKGNIYACRKLQEAYEKKRSYY